VEQHHAQRGEDRGGELAKVLDVRGPGIEASERGRQIDRCCEQPDRRGVLGSDPVTAADDEVRERIRRDRQALRVERDSFERDPTVADEGEGEHDRGRHVTGEERAQVGQERRQSESGDCDVSAQPVAEPTRRDQSHDGEQGAETGLGIQVCAPRHPLSDEERQWSDHHPPDNVSEQDQRNGPRRQREGTQSALSLDREFKHLGPLTLRGLARSTVESRVRGRLRHRGRSRRGRRAGAGLAYRTTKQ